MVLGQPHTQALPSPERGKSLGTRLVRALKHGSIIFLLLFALISFLSCVKFREKD